MREAGELMATWGHGGLPVVDEGAARGARHAQGRTTRRARHGLDHAPVKGFMARDVVSVHPTPTCRSSSGCWRRRASAACRSSTSRRARRHRHPQGRAARRARRRVPRPQARRRRARSRRARSCPRSRRLLPDEARAALHELGALAEATGVRAHVVGGFVRDMLLGEAEPRHRRGRRGRRRGLRRGGRAAGSERAREGAPALRHRGARPLAANCTSTSRARAPSTTRGPARCPPWSARRCGRTCCDATSRSTRWPPASTPTASVRSPTRSAGCRDLERRRRARAALAVLRRGPHAGAARRALRGALRLPHGRARPRRWLATAVEMGMLDEVSGARVREELIDMLDEEPAVPAFARLAELRRTAERCCPTASSPRRAVALLRAAEDGCRTLSDALPEPPATGARRCCRSLGGSASCRRGGEVAAQAPARPRARSGGPRRRRARADRAAPPGGPARDARQPPARAAARRCRPRRSSWLWAAGDDAGRARDRCATSAVLSRVRPAVTGNDLVETGLRTVLGVLCYPCAGSRRPARRNAPSAATPNSRTCAGSL